MLSKQDFGCKGECDVEGAIVLYVGHRHFAAHAILIIDATRNIFLNIAWVKCTKDHICMKSDEFQKERPEANYRTLSAKLELSDPN